eukprot:m.24938 g.24938  ORF g.24938 m.24938 type:complete len:277 (-) comp9659_c0_seq6:152-982(-)
MVVGNGSSGSGRSRRTICLHGLTLPLADTESDSDLHSVSSVSATTTAPESAAREQLGRRQTTPRKEPLPLVGRENSLVRQRSQRRAAGVRRRRRWDNLCSLKSALEKLSEDEPLVPETIIVESHNTFSTLHSDGSKLHTWEQFLAKSAPEQEAILGCLHRTSSSVAHHERTPLQRYAAIDRSIRVVLRKSNLPVITLAALEDDLMTYFCEDSQAVYICTLDSFRRLLLHGLCQFLGLHSESDTVQGERVTTVKLAEGARTFSRPDTLLSTLLQSMQ